MASSTPASSPEEYRNQIKATETQADWSITTLEIEKLEDYEDMNKMKVDFYNQNAEVYNDDFAKYKYKAPQRGAEYLHKYLKGRVDARILDVGAGTGLVAQELKKLADYNHIDAIDASPNMLAVAQQSQLYENLFIQRFTVDSGIPVESYDAVVCIGAFLPGHLKAEAIKEMHALLKPGGFVVFGVKSEYLMTEPDLSKLRPFIAEMVAEGKATQVCEDEVKGTFIETIGIRVFVLQKC